MVCNIGSRKVHNILPSKVKAKAVYPVYIGNRRFGKFQRIDIIIIRDFTVVLGSLDWFRRVFWEHAGKIASAPRQD